MKKKRSRKYSFADTLEMEEYCRAHFEEYFPSSDFTCNVTQLSSGSLSTSTTCAPIKDAHLEIFKTNQTLLYEEDANRESVAFCWLDLNALPSKNPTSIISGYKLGNSSIAGFNRLNKTGGNIWDLVAANENICCMSLKWDKLKARMNQLNAYNAFARIEECIGIDSENQSSLQLKSLFKNHFSEGLKNSEKLYDLAVATLEDTDEFTTKAANRSDHTDLLDDLVKLIHEDRFGLPPISLTEISDYLGTNNQSLSSLCRTTFNMRIIELVQCIRLEQSRKAFINPHASKGLKLFTKEKVSCYYGFKSWKKFEHQYTIFFGESPVETIERTSKTMLSFADVLNGGEI